MNISETIQEQTFSKVKNDFDESNKFKVSTDTIPTFIPKTWSEQVVIYKNGATIRKYIYVDSTWHYVTLT